VQSFVQLGGMAFSNYYSPLCAFVQSFEKLCVIALSHRATKIHTIMIYKPSETNHLLVCKSALAICQLTGICQYAKNKHMKIVWSFSIFTLNLQSNHKIFKK